MNVFIDTSAIIAVLDAEEPNHILADRIWQMLLDGDDQILTTNYVLSESSALIQRRLGMAAIGELFLRMAPVFQPIWLDAEMHRQGVQALLAANRRSLSLVDCTSFIAMRQLHITHAFAFDQHFEQQGFTCLR